MIGIRKISAILIGAITVTALKGSIFASDLEEPIKGQPHSRVNIIESILAQGLIDEDTASDIETYLQAKNENSAQEMKGIHTKMFDKMLEGEVLTQEEYDALIAYYTTLVPETKGMPPMNDTDAEMKGKDMENRPEISAERSEREKPELVSENQTEDINRNSFSSRGGLMYHNTDKLVEEGIINEDTAAKIQAYIQENQLGFPSEFDGEHPKMANEEPKKNKIEKHDIFTELLENNIITQNQYNAVTAAHELTEAN